MSTSPEPQVLPTPVMVAGPSPLLTPQPTLAPSGSVLSPPPVAMPLPTPGPQTEATPGPLPLAGRGHHVAAVEIVGQTVKETGPLHALHLEEVIRYSDGHAPDIVGYDPEGRGGIAHEGSKLFAETSLDGKTPEQYIADAEKNYRLEIKATKDQTLDHFVARQEHSWEMYDRSPGVPRYGAGGNDQTFHNSNGSMIASIRDAGRGDVADQIQRAVEPPAEMHRLEQDLHLEADAASAVLAVDRRIHGAPIAPGASHELTPAQVRGLATPEPRSDIATLSERESGGIGNAALVLVERGLQHESRDVYTTAVAAVSVVANGVQRETQAAVATLRASISALSGSARESGRPRDMLDGATPSDGAHITIMRTQADGTQSLALKQVPFRQSGPIISVDGERVTQGIRGGETFTYNTKDLLRSAQDPDAALRDLHHAAQRHENITLHAGAGGLQMTPSATTLQRGYDGRSH